MDYIKVRIIEILADERSQAEDALYRSRLVGNKKAELEYKGWVNEADEMIDWVKNK